MIWRSWFLSLQFLRILYFPASSKCCICQQDSMNLVIFVLFLYFEKLVSFLIWNVRTVLENCWFLSHKYYYPCCYRCCTQLAESLGKDYNLQVLNNGAVWDYLDKSPKLRYKASVPSLFPPPPPPKLGGWRKGKVCVWGRKGYPAILHVVATLFRLKEARPWLNCL